ncbi:MAG: hypothetical protein ACYCOU_22985 [Sulfobacillus sp.]
MVQLTLQGPRSERDKGEALLADAIQAAGLDGWFHCFWRLGRWQLVWEDRLIWTGESLDVVSWTNALLQAWWGESGGCC